MRVASLAKARKAETSRQRGDSQDLEHPIGNKGRGAKVVRTFERSYNRLRIIQICRELGPLTERPRILLLGDAGEDTAPLLARLGDTVETVPVQNPIRAFARLAREKFDAVYVGSPHLGEALELGKLLQNERILEQMPDGVVLLDGDNTVIWGNGRLREWTDRESIVGLNFYAVLGSPEILGPDFCPFHTALATGARSCSTLRSTTTATSACTRFRSAMPTGRPQNLIVTIRDVTSEVCSSKSSPRFIRPASSWPICRRTSSRTCRSKSASSS